MGTQARRPRRDVTGILLLDKPLGLSSNAALQQVKRLFQAGKAGHTGSLDPLASGVLPICLGEATKLCGVLLESEKCYRARARLGQRTSTGDAEGEVIETSELTGAIVERLQAVLPQFLGDILQVPPMYSALKRDGQRLYELARAGQEVAREARAVRILELRLLQCNNDGFEFEVRCSKGTYIRTLAEDWARAAGQCAHLVSLRRTAVTPFEDAPLVTLEQLEAQDELILRDRLLLSPAQGLAHWPQVSVDAVQATRLSSGQSVCLPELGAMVGRVAVVGAAGDLLGLGEVAGRGEVFPRRWLCQ